MLVILAWLTIVAGRSNQEEGIVLNRVDKMKTEIFILLSVAVMVICIYGEISLSYSLLNGVWFSGDGFNGTSVLIFCRDCCGKRLHDRTYFLAWNGKKDQGKDFVEEQYFMSDHQIRPD